MAILELLSVSKLEGYYDITKRELSLIAEINIENITSGIQFARVPWFGGLKYELVGWVGPPTQPSTKPFEEKFPLTKLLPVIVSDREHPNEIALDIHVIGGLIDLGDAKKVQAAPSTLTNLNEVFPLTPITINTLYKMTFLISVPAETPKFGEVIPTFDQSFLELEDARIIDNNIIWTFLTVQTGHTQVIINILGGIALYHKTITYDINISLPLEPGPVIQSS
ncbi:hypothetical protein G7Y89_g3813 [Cudoniella acicularis]|uniref:Uncharacterized protein n=1 Tax=Cudoniella acicularis TaxID=354080 RepID=A0A8H4RRH1_9HELO|nr:hypothetical protein G7Y89_g3813 [Cudoniella acicularis]